jgi:hypothetical protein
MIADQPALKNSCLLNIIHAAGRTNDRLELAASGKSDQQIAQLDTGEM